MQITQRQKHELEQQLPKVVKHWPEIARLLGSHPSRYPSSVDGFCGEEAEKILNFLNMVN
jgi:hypothetical protein